jgi:hypothetical protein
MSINLIDDLGLLFDSVRRFPSPERLNIKCWVRGTGNQIQDIDQSDIEDGMAFSVTEDSDDMTLRKGVAYLLVDGNFVSINSGTHSHMNSNDGGKLTRALGKGMYDVWHRNYLNPERFGSISSATNGTVSMSASGFLLLTANSGQANNVVNCYDRGLLYTFTQNLYFYGRVKLTDVSTNYMTRIGFNGDDAQTVTPTVNPQVVIEGCDTCNTNKVTIVSADGTARQKDETPITDLVTDIGNYYLEHIPSEVKILYKRNNTTFVTKDDTIPTTGLPSRTRLFHAGIQTKNTVAKVMEIYGFNVTGTIGEANWNEFAS